jgi:ParB-like chromosome segregation protein Spo0J
MSDRTTARLNVTPPELHNLRLEELCEPRRNPNSMSKEDFDNLARAMLYVGNVQPVLVRRVEGRTTPYEIVDGVHRARAVRSLLSSDPIADKGEEALRQQFASLYARDAMPCVVVDLTDDEARATQIAMNRLRGKLDLGSVAKTLEELHLAGWGVLDLPLTGYTKDEIDHLLASNKSVDDDLLDAASGLDEPAETTERPFVLEFTFETRAELAKVKRYLRKAAGGKGNPLEKGLLALIEGG